MLIEEIYKMIYLKPCEGATFMPVILLTYTQFIQKENPDTDNDTNLGIIVEKMLINKVESND